MAIEIRHYQERDRQQLIGLWTNIFDDAGPHNNPQYMLNSKLAMDDKIYIASQEDQVIGAIISGYDGHRGWLYSLAVNKNFQRQGIGRQLVEFAVEKLNAAGCAKVNLQVRGDNKEVVVFYRSLGFTIEDRVSMGKMLM